MYNSHVIKNRGHLSFSYVFLCILTVRGQCCALAAFSPKFESACSARFLTASEGEFARFWSALTAPAFLALDVYWPPAVICERSSAAFSWVETELDCRILHGKTYHLDD